MSVSRQKQPISTFKTLPKQCNTCLSHYRDCDCPKSWYEENVVPREQRLHIRFPENATTGTCFDACHLPIEAILLLAQFMNPLTLLAMMQAFYPWIMPATFMSHLRHNATHTYRMMHDFLICLETGFISYDRIVTRSYGPLPKCFEFTCSPKHVVGNILEHTCNCGFTYDLNTVRFSMVCAGITMIDFKYMQNASELYLYEFTGTFDFWTGPRMGPYAHKYDDDKYEYDAELEANTDITCITKARVKADNKSRDREKKIVCAHKNARNSRDKRYCVKGRNTPKNQRDLSLV
jgi:hypothetical protein